MCVAVPMRVISIEGEHAMTEIDGVKREANLILLDEDVNVGDFVIVHGGFAISKLDEEEAKETLALMRELIAAESL